ncbi:hypothetical protein LX69_02238 [Breznakibacter xylanolyticus]|uniref:Transposase n=1 Tax=Breznakibacter xylanolyticus TaxID=990 RepID=A0A2W7N506_9BACT|nr:hypothetical protein LX69_02238 [Breznakibacter xylanolyticus]
MYTSVMKRVTLKNNKALIVKIKPSVLINSFHITKKLISEEYYQH